MDGGPAPRGTFAPVVLAGRRPPIERWLAILAVVLVIAVIKPWPSPEAPEGSGAAAGPTVRFVPETAATSPSPSSALEGTSAQVSGFCLDPGVWMVASVERWRDQRIRVWRALEPASSANGPDDAAIPIVPVVSDGLTELGWCAPVRGAEKVSGPVDITVWLRSASVARPITVDISRPASGRSPFGELYRPVGRIAAPGAASWSSGTYIFRHREKGGRVRWFGVEVEIRATRSPAPSRAP